MADAHDALAMRYLGMCDRGIGQALAAEGKAQQAIPFARRALQIAETLTAADRADTLYKPGDVANARAALGEIYSR